MAFSGAARIPASSGKTHRMRLHTDGGPNANIPPHMIIACRLRYHPYTQDNLAK